MHSPINRLNRAAYMGLLTALALILSYIEALIPFQPGIPGIKIGLANLAVLICLYLFGWKEAMLLTVVRVLVGGFLFGNLFMIAYSLSGALCSAVTMILLRRSGGFHIPVVSAAGGVMHNMGQLMVAFWAVDSYSVVYYMPVLILSGLITGIVIGTIGALVLPYIKNIVGRGQLK